MLMKRICIPLFVASFLFTTNLTTAEEETVEVPNGDVITQKGDYYMSLNSAVKFKCGTPGQIRFTEYFNSAEGQFNGMVINNYDGAEANFFYLSSSHAYANNFAKDKIKTDTVKGISPFVSDPQKTYVKGAEFTCVDDGKTIMYLEANGIAKNWMLMTSVLTVIVIAFFLSHIFY